MCFALKNIKPPTSAFGNQVKYQFMQRHVPVATDWLCSSSSVSTSSSRTTSSEPGCSCDIECVLFGDCCIDAFNTTFGKEADSSDNEEILHVQDPLTLYEKLSQKRLEKLYLPLFYEHSRCHRININESYTNLALIDRCPVDYPEGVDFIFREKCENASNEVLNTIPVSLEFSENWQIAFSNIFCALCHGFEKDDIISWDAHADCRGNFNLTTENFERSISTSCVKVYIPPDTKGKLRRCHMEYEMKSKCQTEQQNTTDSIACQLYIAPVWFSDELYKNIHCGYCGRSNVSKDEFIHAISNVNKATWLNKPSQGQAGTFNKAPTGTFNKAPTPQPLPSMKILFDFTYQAGLAFTTEGSPNDQRTKRCNDNEIFNLALDTCKTVVCPKDLVYVNGRCQYKTMTFNDEENILPITSDDEDGLIVSVVSQNKAGENVNERVIAKRYKETLEEILNKYVTKINIDSNSTVKALACESHNVHQIMTNLDEDILYSCLHLQSDGILGLSDVIKAVKKFTRLISRHSVLRSTKVLQVTLSDRSFGNNFTCPGDRHVIHEKELTIDTINDTVYFIDRQMQVANNALNTIFSLAFMADSGKTQAQDVVICSQLVCPLVELSKEEYIFENETLRMLETGKRITPDNFEIRNNSVYMCISTRVSKILLTPNFDMPKALLIQLVTYSMSITALFLTILIYVRYVSLRTLHGKSLVSLSASLIVAQLAGLLPIETGTVWCKLAAILMHISWLSAFGWMGMISYNMATTFFGKQTTVANTHVDRRRYFAYSLVGWCLPAFIGIICVILDNFNVPEMLQVGYGEGVAGCFISGKGIFIFFSLPNLISVLFNTIAFILTVYGITSRRKIVPSSNRSRDRWYFLIYVKLSVVMGVAWLVAILASITHQMFLWYIHFVLNGLQGLFIFISFALRASIWKKMRMDKLGKPTKFISVSKKASLYSVSGNSAILSQESQVSKNILSK